MHRAFRIDKINGLNNNSLQKTSNSGDERFEIYKSISNFKSQSGALDGTAIIDSYFPQIHADVFISHSHRDIEDVRFIKEKLSKIGIEVFIDSDVWEFCDILLKEIDDEYNKVNIMCHQTRYNYKTRNISTSNVYTMLSMSLAKMIRNTECLFFYNTPNSITKKDISTNSKTLSPWIFLELEMAKILEKRSPEEHRRSKKELLENLQFFSTKNLEIEYEVNLSHLTQLNASFFENWLLNKFNNGEEALDYLYEKNGTNT